MSLRKLEKLGPGLPGQLEVEDSTLSKVRQSLIRTHLPAELWPKQTDRTLAQIKELIEWREANGLGAYRIIGYHVSNIDLRVGEELKPDAQNEVYYTTDIANLYGRNVYIDTPDQRTSFIYIIDGKKQDPIIDKGLSWRKTQGRVKIIDKIKMTPENLAKLGADFAECEYHG